MMSLFVSLLRLIKIIVTGIKEDDDFRFLFFFMLMLFVSATIFYTNVEGWSVVDALYFSTMTMSTVGYGDLTPTTDMSKIFTIIYSFLSIGSFVAFTSKMVKIIIDNSNKKREKIQEKLKK